MVTLTLYMYNRSSFFLFGDGVQAELATILESKALDSEQHPCT